MTPTTQTTTENQSFDQFRSSFGAQQPLRLLSVPGRVNLIGEHIDYHDLQVLPVAIQRHVSVAFRPRNDNQVNAVSAVYGSRSFVLCPPFRPEGSGDWLNYLKAAAQIATDRWALRYGIDASVASDLPPAAGLSSSSALMVAFTLALLEANGIRPTFEELMDVLPDGEHFVGTRGGGMDHAAVLRARANSALLIQFAPLDCTPIAIPPGWSFLVGHSLTTAEKSGSARAEYNARRASGLGALEKLGFPSFRSAIESHSVAELTCFADRDSRLCDAERRCFLHVVTEQARVREAVVALEENKPETFGRLLTGSHRSLRDQLRVSSPALDRLVETALGAGALGARLTGAGFGGCAIIFCKTADLDRLQAELIKKYYKDQSGFDPQNHLFVAEPSAGALIG